MCASFQEAEDQALIRLFRVAVHELRNPLTAVTGILQLLQQDLPSGHADEQLVHLAQVETGRITCLLAEFAEAIHATDYALPTRFAPLNLGNFVRDLVAVFSSVHLGRRMSIRTSASLVVMGDDRRLAEVFHNLLGNAIKYSVDGSEIRVDLCATEHWALVSVFNEGLGIPPDQLDEIFAPFVRARNLAMSDPGGMGLGLYISRQIVENGTGDDFGRKVSPDKVRPSMSTYPSRRGDASAATIPMRFAVFGGARGLLCSHRKARPAPGGLGPKAGKPVISRQRTISRR